MGYKIRGNTLYVTGTVNGKHYRLSTGKEANSPNIKWLSKNHRDVLLKLIDKDKPHKTDLFKDYADISMKANKHSIKASTYKNYKRFLKSYILPFFQHYRLDEIKTSDVKIFQAQLLDTLSVRSTKNIIALVSKIMKDAWIDDLIEKNPVTRVTYPKHISDDEIMPFTLDEILTLIDAAKGFYKSFLTVAFFTGMRQGELIALKWSDIDFNSSKIVVRRSRLKGVEGTTKTGKTRIIDMIDAVKYSLTEQYRLTGLLDGYVFLNRKNLPYGDSSTVSLTYWRPLLKRCAIAYRVPYNTRHSFATLMLKNGEDILWVSKMLGHANVATTMKYYIKFVEEKGQKRATFLDDVSLKKRTNIAHLKNKNSTSA